MADKEKKEEFTLTFPGVAHMITRYVDSYDDMGKHVRQIVAISRGGLFIAQSLAYLMNVRRMAILCVMGYGDDKRQRPTLDVISAPDPQKFNNPLTLFVDDISDTGRTMALVQQNYPHAKKFALIVKPEGEKYVDGCCIQVAQDTWVNFPWELKRGAYQDPYGELVGPM